MKNSTFSLTDSLRTYANIAIVSGVLLLSACSEGARPEPENAEPLPIKVRVHKVENEALTMWHVAEGIAQATNKEFLQFESPGSVTFIGQDSNGQPLREGSRVVGPKPGSRFGQLLARLDRRDNNARVAQADAEVSAALRRIEAAEAALTQAASEFERQTKLQTQGVSVAAEYEMAEAQHQAAIAQMREAQASAQSIAAQAQEAKLGLERTSLFAPFDGVISVLNLRQGDFSPGPNPDSSDANREANAAIVLIDDSAFEVTLQVPPFEAPLYAEGQRALVSTSSHDLGEALRSDKYDGVLTGTVWSVSPAISLQSRYVTVKLRVSGSDGVLLDGSYVTAWIATSERSAVLVAPYRALSTTGLESSVYVIDRKTGTAELRPVSLGLLGLNGAEIETGLELGDEIVIEGQHLLRENSTVQVITENASVVRETDQ